MFSVYLFKTFRLLPLLALPYLAWLLPSTTPESAEDFSPEKINLSLHRTADGLLRASGDSTSRIPAIEEAYPGIWRVRLEQPFSYEQLPALLQASLELYGIQRPYEVALRRCSDATIELGYHQLDYLQSSNVPCRGREMPEGCHFIEIKFAENEIESPFWTRKAEVLLLILAAGLGGFWLSRRKKSKPASTMVAGETDWLEFGNSRLDVAGQVLICSEIRQTLTFREAKLLRLFVNRPDRLLERNFILQEVWLDEGILVGRSVDVFVSRLRKKLAADPTVGIVAVHGVGYRLKTGKIG